MEFRKIIRFGKNSFVVTLPKEWLKINNLNKGDTILVNENADGLQISLKERKKSDKLKAIIINTEGKTLNQIQIELISAYVAGYNVMEIRSKNIIGDAPKIKSMLKELAGIELIEETSNKIVVKDLMNMEELSINVLIRRAELIVSGMIDDLLKSIYENQSESIYQRDKEVNRLVFLTRRLLRFACDNHSIMEKFQQSVIDLIRAWKIVGHIELIGDNTKRIARTLEKVKLKDNEKKELQGLILMLKKRYIEVMKSYHTNNVNTAVSLELSSKKQLAIIEVFQIKNPTCYDIAYNLKSMAFSIEHIGRAIMNTII